MKTALLASPFPVVVAGRTFTLRPLTMRERGRVANEAMVKARERAISLGEALGLKGADLFRAVSDSCSEAARVSSIVMNCFTMEGAIAVLAIASATAEDCEDLVSLADPATLGTLAARCLGVALDEKPTGDTPGNA